MQNPNNQQIQVSVNRSETLVKALGTRVQQVSRAEHIYHKNGYILTPKKAVEHAFILAIPATVLVWLVFGVVSGNWLPVSSPVIPVTYCIMYGVAYCGLMFVALRPVELEEIIIHFSHDEQNGQVEAESVKIEIHKGNQWQFDDFPLSPSKLKTLCKLLASGDSFTRNNLVLAGVCSKNGYGDFRQDLADLGYLKLDGKETELTDKMIAIVEELSK